MRNAITKTSLLYLSIGIATSVFLGVFFSPATNASSQITLSPTDHRLQIAPGRTYEGSLTVINSGDEPLNARVYAAPYQVQNEAYDPVFNRDTPRTQISRWITLEKDSYQLAPSEQVNIPYKIITPASIPDGGQYASIFVETSDESDGAIMRKKRVGMLVYANTEGKTKESGSVKLDSFGSLQMVKDLTINERLINDGNTDLMADVTVKATSLSGKELFSQTIQKPVLPDTTRLVAVQWQNTPSIGIVKLSQTVQFVGKKTTSDQWMLIITPIWLLIILAMITLILGGITYAVRSAKKRPKIRRLR